MKQPVAIGGQHMGEEEGVRAGVPEPPSPEALEQIDFLDGARPLWNDPYKVYVWMSSRNSDVRPRIREDASPGHARLSITATTAKDGQMVRAKMFVGLAAAIGVILGSAGSASAEFESTNGQTTGVASVITSGEFKYPGAVVKCPNKAEINAQWQIQAKGQIKQQQAAVKKGPNLKIQVKAWGKCESTIGMTKAEATVGECSLQLRPATVSFIKTACVIKTGACVIQIPAGMETKAESGEGINVGLEGTLQSVTESKLLNNLIVKGGGVGQAAGEGIFAQASGGSCSLAKSSEEGVLTGMSFEATGINIPTFMALSPLTYDFEGRKESLLLTVKNKSSLGEETIEKSHFATIIEEAESSNFTLTTNGCDKKTYTPEESCIIGITSKGEVGKKGTFYLAFNNSPTLKAEVKG